MPPSRHKARVTRLGRSAKKSELSRAGLKLLGALEAVPSIKTGRPKGKRHGKDHSADGDTPSAAREG